jgi:hypothetical protein
MFGKTNWNIPKEELWIDGIDRELIHNVQTTTGIIQSRSLRRLMAKYRTLIDSSVFYINRTMPLNELGITTEELLYEIEHEFFITCIKYDLSKKLPLTNRFRLRIGTYIHNNYANIRSKKKSVKIDEAYLITGDMKEERYQSRIYYSDNMVAYENRYNTGGDKNVEKISFKDSYTKFLSILTPIETEILDMKLRGISNDRINKRYNFKQAPHIIRKKMKMKAIACGLIEKVPR